MSAVAQISTERSILIDKGNDARKWIAHAETAIARVAGEQS